MSKPIQRLIMLVVVSSLLLAAISPALADGVSTKAVTAPIAASLAKPVVNRSANDVLFSSLKGSIENIHKDKTSAGTRLIAKVVLRNPSNKIVRIPGAYEVRLVMDNGMKYTLSADAGNTAIIQPLNEVKLSYMTIIETDQALVPASLEWVYVNLDVYPKTETVKLALQAPVIDWQNDSSDTELAAIYKWGEKFTIPALHSSLIYTPVSLKLEKMAADDQTIKNAAFVTFLVENPEGKQVAVPDLTINAKTVTGIVYTSQAANEPAHLESFEKKYITYLFAAGDPTKLASLTILTPETFALASATGLSSTTSYSIGRLKIVIPAELPTEQIQAKDYVWGTPMIFDSIHSLIPSNLQVSIVGESLLANDEVGFKKMLVLFKLNNKGEQTLELPDIPLELVSAEGYHYAGTRESTSFQQLIPNKSYIVPYTFLLPTSESGQQLTIQALDVKSYAPFKTVLAAYKLALPTEQIQAKDYVWDTPMILDSIHSLIPSNLQVSIVGESLLANDEVGFKNMLVQFKLNNKGEQTLELPDIPLELVSAEGYHYAGTRESTSFQQLIPNTSYIVPYTFLLPTSESGQQLTIQALDAKSYAPFKTVLAAYKLILPTDSTDDLSFTVYPYKLAISSKAAPQTIVYTDPMTGNSTTGLSWKTDISLIRTPNIFASPTSSKLQFELLDGNSKLLSTTVLGFAGSQKIINGEQDIIFNRLDLNSSTSFSSLTIRIYETYDTPLGPVKRYLGKVAKS